MKNAAKDVKTATRTFEQPSRQPTPTGQFHCLPQRAYWRYNQGRQSPATVKRSGRRAKKDRGVITILSANIKAIRKAKGLSQEELANQLHVVRQTISKWENGSSVPDADLLISLAAALETPVNVLLGATVAMSDTAAATTAATTTDLHTLSRQLEQINRLLAQKKEQRRRLLHWLCLSLCLISAALLVFLFIMGSPYLSWEQQDPQSVVIGVGLHALEWLSVRCAPLVFVAAAIGAYLTRHKSSRVLFPQESVCRQEPGDIHAVEGNEDK